jgi:hypothetical protein
MEEQGLISVSKEHLVFAYYVTGHGFGHATRVVEVYFLTNLQFSSSILALFLSFDEFELDTEAEVASCKVERLQW